jgi:RNA polymerase sigma factor (sigma-70 family)
MQSISACPPASYRGPVAGVGRELDSGRPSLGIIGVMKGFGDSEARMLRAICAGDTAAWQRFVLQYSNFIYGAVVRFTDDYDEKMAVYLHVLEKLREDRCRRLGQFAFRSKLSTWLTVVSRRLALDFLRSRYGRDFGLKRIRVVSIDAEPGTMRLLAGAMNPEKELAAAERQEWRERLERGLRLAMDRLDDRERLAVQMVYFQGMRIREVGRLLAQPAVYKFVARALKKIRCEMERSQRLGRAEVAEALEGEAHE